MLAETLFIVFFASGFVFASPAEEVNNIQKETVKGKIKNLLDNTLGEFFKVDQLNTRKFALLWKPFDNIDDKDIKQSVSEMQTAYNNQSKEMNNELKELAETFDKGLKSEPDKIDQNLIIATMVVDKIILKWILLNEKLWKDQMDKSYSLFKDYLLNLNRLYLRGTVEARYANWTMDSSMDIFKMIDVQSSKFMMLWKRFENFKKESIRKKFEEIQKDYYTIKDACTKELNAIEDRWNSTLRTDNPDKLDENIESANRELNIHILKWLEIYESLYNSQTEIVRNLIYSNWVIDRPPNIKNKH